MEWYAGSILWAINEKRQTDRRNGTDRLPVQFPPCVIQTHRQQRLDVADRH
jgi:hypothetical protein